MKLLKLAGGTAAAVAMVGLAVPAEAQRWGGPRHRHHDRFDVGDALVGGLIVGGFLALTSHKKKPREAEEVYDAPPVEEEVAPPMDVPMDSAPAEDGEDAARPGSGAIEGTPAPDSARFDGFYDEDAAADRCAQEAESMGERYARLAHVSSIVSTVWNGKDWVVKGQVELSGGYRDLVKQSHDFRCSLKRGSDPAVLIEGLGAV